MKIHLSERFKPAKCPSWLLSIALFLPIGVILSGCGETEVRTSHTSPAVINTETYTNTPQAVTFTHPGLLHSAEDFIRMREKVQAQQEPWISGWNELIADGFSQIGDNKPLPLEILIRGNVPGQNFGRIVNETRRAYQLALRWKISGDDNYANLAVDYLNAWSSTLVEITGNADRYLAAGLYAFDFANAAEIMRSYDGWAAGDQTRFKDMLVNVFYPLSHDFLINHNDACISNYWANWDLANIEGMMAIGIFADRPDIYQEALTYLYTGEGNGALDNLVYHLHPGNMGQFQESGRDQGHATLGVSLFGAIAKMAWNQQVDLFSYHNYRLLSAAEYIARYNLLEDVPYTAYGPNCKSARTAQTVISSLARGLVRPSWELIYNVYENQFGIAAPWSKKMAEKSRPEKFRNGDELGWGTLTETQSRIGISGGKPRGLTAELSADTVILSWWGAAGADSYQIKRGTLPDGPFATIHSTSASEILSYTDTDIVADQDYYYQISAVSAAGVSNPSNTVSVHTGPQLLVHFSFDEAAGNSASGGSNISAKLSNGASFVSGKIGNAILLDGVDDFVNLPQSIASTLSDFSITSWVYIDAATSWARLFDFGFGDQRYMTLVPHSSSSQTCFIITKISHHGDQRVCADALQTGQWVHVAFTLSGTTGVLYLNGTEVARNESMTLAPFRLGATTQNWLGRSQYQGDGYLSGKIDDLRIYSGALSDTAVATLASEQGDSTLPGQL